MKTCPKYTFGVGDRFARSAPAQLRAFQAARALGAEVTPVWNKSNREHNLIGSEPAETRAVADRTVRALGWEGPYLLDADHIGLKTVDRFLPHCDFFTIDVADDIGQAAPEDEIEAFLARHPELVGTVAVEGLAEPLVITREQAAAAARQFLKATQLAGVIYRHILAGKGPDFVTEVSMDETHAPQTPPELLLILAALADAGVPVQTIAPKFTGRFNKGVDYVGDVAQFEREFNADLAVIAHAVRAYGLPAGLKLSVHSGSDKFSLYPVIRRALARTGAGLHLKTAGTNWLEELIGLAEAGGEALALVKEIYAKALAKQAELVAPYATVVDIDPARLPSAAEVAGWSGPQLAAALRHEQADPAFNPHFRQLLHVAFKVAAGLGGRYQAALEAHAADTGRCVTHNLLERHLKPLFVG